MLPALNKKISLMRSTCASQPGLNSNTDTLYILVSPVRDVSKEDTKDEDMLMTVVTSGYMRVQLWPVAPYSNSASA